LNFEFVIQNSKFKTQNFFHPSSLSSRLNNRGVNRRIISIARAWARAE